MLHTIPSLLLVVVTITVQHANIHADAAVRVQSGSVFQTKFTTQPNVTFDPSTLTMKERSTASVNLTWSVVVGNQSHVSVSSSDTRVLHVTSFNYTSWLQLGNDSLEDVTSVTVQITAQRLGKASIIFNLGEHQNVSSGTDREYNRELPISAPAVQYPVVVVRRRGIQDQVLHISIQILLGILNFAFGCQLDMQIIWKYIKRPMGPSIGFCSQFVIMPLLGLAISKLLQMDTAFAVGLIALSCAPGGGASNSWTILLGGDVDLSLTMTFLSLILALGMMPLWIFIMATIYLDPSMIQIPYLQILTTLLFFVGPCFLGVTLKYFRREWARPVTYLIKPVSVIFLLWVTTFGTYVNLYMFKIMAEVPTTIAAGILLPWCGFFFGFVFAVVTKQGRSRSIAIAIETGIQNIGVPIVLLQRNFPQPEGDLAATMVNSVAIFTPIPLFVVLIILSIKKRLKQSDKIDANGEFERDAVAEMSDTLVCDITDTEAFERAPGSVVLNCDKNLDNTNNQLMETEQ